MKIQSIPKRGRKGSVIYSETRHGNVARQFVPPQNARTDQQQEHRRNVRAVSARWSTLTQAQKSAWRTVAANKYFLNDEGKLVRRTCYTLFVSLNSRRADLGLPQFDEPPAQPAFSENPVKEVVATFTGGKFSLKARLTRPPEHLVLVCAAAPVRSGVRHVSHFPFLTLLPPPTDGWSDLTDPYVARYGVPKPDWAIWTRTCQHSDGWTDAPKVSRSRLPPTAT